LIVKRCLFVLCGLLVAAGARAETRRLAVVVGNNVGTGRRAPLRYAENDAAKIAAVLRDLGGVHGPDVFLLQGAPLSRLRGVLGEVSARVGAWSREKPEANLVLLFYFSGHSDGEAIELGRERLAFRDLRKMLRETGAQVRVTIVDSCQSGRLVAAKGGQLGPAFDVRLSDDLASTGEALLMSSAASESSLESREIHGSFFTHHLVSGLRGAADFSGDGRVTLSEAYRYAFAHTVETTAQTTIGPQHPTYDYQLTGRGELVLSDLRQPSASLEVPPGFDRVLLIALAREQVVAELPQGARGSRLWIPAGEYMVYLWRGGQPFGGRVFVREGEARVLDQAELRATTPPQLRTKGESDAGDEAGTVHRTVFIGVGGPGGVATHPGGQHLAARVGVRAASATGWTTAVDLSYGQNPSFSGATSVDGQVSLRSELGIALYGGYRLGFDYGALRAYLGAELGVYLAYQFEDDHDYALATGPVLGCSISASRALAITLEAKLPITLYSRHFSSPTYTWPTVLLGLEW